LGAVISAVPFFEMSSCLGDGYVQTQIERLMKGGSGEKQRYEY